MNKYLSRKISILSFLLILMVVVKHACTLPYANITSGPVFWIEQFFVYGINEVAVPLFFVISGYLFFRNIDRGGQVFEKWRSRSKTLLVPYVLWVTFYLVAVLSVNAVSPGLIGNVEVGEYPLFIVKSFFVNPPAEQLWFLKDLIYLVILAPVIYYLVKYLKKWFVLFLLVLYLCPIKFFHIFLFTKSALSLLFFSFGAYLGLFRQGLLLQKKHKGLFVFLFLWVLFSGLKVVFICNNIEHGEVLGELAKDISTIFGLFAMSLIYDGLEGKLKIKCVDPYIGFTFFIFCAHDPAIQAVKHLLMKVFGRGEYMMLLIWGLSAIVIVALCIAAGAFLKKHTPRFYGIITGAR